MISEDEISVYFFAFVFKKKGNESCLFQKNIRLKVYLFFYLEIKRRSSDD